MAMTNVIVRWCGVCGYHYTVAVFIVIVLGVNGPFILFHQHVSDSTEQ